MTKTVRFRDRANLDVQQSVDWLIKDSGKEVADSFIDELETQISTISRMPQSGSSRFAVELGNPDLRFQVMLRHHHLIFYVDTPSHIDIIRVLDSRRDLNGLL
jgi:toxin ParE1/3/4